MQAGGQKLSKLIMSKVHFVGSLVEAYLDWAVRQQGICFRIQTHPIYISPAEPPDGHIL